jgi:hypothetical protein
LFDSNEVSTLDWQNGAGGLGMTGANGQTTSLFFWPAVAWPQWESAGITWSNWMGADDWSVLTNSSYAGPEPQGEHCDASETWPTGDEQRTADAEYKLATGGPFGSTQQNLWVISASATAYTNLSDTVGTPIPPQEIAIGSLGNLDTNGNLYALLPDNVPVPVTPKAKNRDKVTFTAYGAKYTLTSRTHHPALTNTNRSRTTLGVGERVDLGFSPPPWFALHWANTGGSLSTTLDVSTTLTAPSNATPKVVVTAKLSGGPLVKFPPFKVVEPTGIDHAQIVWTNSFPINNAGAGMTNNFWIAPTSVSFYRVSVLEIGEDATNIYGFFADTNYFTANPGSALRHHPNPDWSGLTPDNMCSDWAAFGQPGYSFWETGGGFEWNIPMKWQIAGSGLTNSMAGCNQVFSIDSNGTARVTKYGNWIQRTTNNVITTN